MKLKNKAPGLFHQRSMISIRDFAKDEILHFLDYTKEIKERHPGNILQGKIMASCFFEPSTRTRLSFESAMKRLGGSVVGFADSKSTSASKKENLYDSMIVIGQYADVIVLRHPLDGAARFVAESTKTPVINAGDGSNQHPTQTLLDLFAMRETQGHLDDLHVAFAGDLKYGRTVHSLVQAASLFNMRMYFIAQSGFELPKQLCDELKMRSILFSFHPSIEEVLSKIDILYMTRIQEERMSHPMEEKKSYIIKQSLLKSAKPNMKILHPLPRVDEIDKDVDSTPHAHYFQQAQSGLYLRQALLSLILGSVHE